MDAERWLAALYRCVRTGYGDDAADAVADCWLRVFEEQLEGSSELPELTRITATAIAVFVSRLALTGVGVEKVSTNWLIFMKSVWQCEAFSGIV